MPKNRGTEYRSCPDLLIARWTVDLNTSSKSAWVNGMDMTNGVLVRTRPSGKLISKARTKWVFKYHWIQALDILEHERSFYRNCIDPLSFGILDLQSSYVVLPKNCKTLGRDLSNALGNANLTLLPHSLGTVSKTITIFTRVLTRYVPLFPIPDRRPHEQVVEDNATNA